ncbi:alpha/beta fold hydrolase [Roseateles sp. DAIF2]|uniref:alpha/beta hydrolase n=1 Tax=Roseateles sp. DAIF2 TaxID=2714952 RepID=UPI0018A3033B|nr:alpha/beta fold hydrolase [Roseateles sp. DAIF2]QPF75594.1 alpha/beta fold hydrolase [Roseateles sp. DAIF2]
MIKRSDYLLQGGRQGVLLIHGLTGTPAEMRFVAKGLHARGFTVHGMQLAGHCGDEADLLASGWRDWSASVEQAALALSAQVDQLFVAGLSMGAVLALQLSIERPGLVSGLGLYGTTFVYDGWTIPPTARLSFLLPLVCALGLGRGRSFMEAPPYGIKDERIRARIAGSMLAGDSAAGGLPGNPWPSLAEFHRLARRVRARLDQVDAPCLAVHAQEDDVASLRNVEILRRGLSVPLQTLVLPDSYHMVTVDQERGRLIEASADFFTALAPRAARQPCAYV